ncbi:nuclear transport factor 2 family protein [Ruegeria arenilitoris]|uniref:nuclear transport factor 2 family protein n=1 Tax=Ruegeria arenilitoris TaxID=1173585 RepID=UPI00147CEF86|nr:nuclear transport factor 2 family protein [Ruegeria arenilitoris]
MGLKSALCTAAFVHSVAPALAEGEIALVNKTLGTPISAENIVDVLEIQRTATNLTLSVDTQQWDVTADLLDGDIETTIGEPVNGAPVVKSEEEILTRWKGFYETAEKLVIHHVTSNDRVFFEDADTATVFSKGVIVLENTPAGDFADDGGTLRGYRWVDYEIGVHRTVDGWKVHKVNVTYLVQEFDSLAAN